MKHSRSAVGNNEGSESEGLRLTRQIRFIAILGRRSQEFAELEELGVSRETGGKV